MRPSRKVERNPSACWSTSASSPSPSFEFTLADLRAGPEGGSAWPGGLRFGRRGYSEHRMLLVAGLSLHCTAPRQLRILPLLTRGLASQHSFRTTGFQPFPPPTAAPRWCVEWCRGACPIWTPERGFIGVDSIRVKGGRNVAPVSSSKRLHVTAVARTMASIIKAAAAGTAHRQIRSTDALQRIFRTTVASHSIWWPDPLGSFVRPELNNI